MFAQANSPYISFIPVASNSYFDIYNSKSNPAIDTTSEFIFSAFVSPAIHELNDLNFASVYFSSKFGKFKPATNFSGIINELFREYSASASLNYSFSEKLTLGSRLSYNEISISDYSSNNFLSVDVGGVINFDAGFSTGFTLFNINSGKYSNSSNTALRTAAFSIGANLNENFTSEISAIIRDYNSSGFAFAAKYSILNDLLAFGLYYLSEPQSIEAAIKINAIDKFNVVITLQHNQNLGYNKNFGIYHKW